MKLALFGGVLTVLLASPVLGAEAQPVLKQSDSLQTVLEGYRGKRVSLRLQGGDEMTGVVKSVTRELVHLEDLSRREFYDAVIALPKVDAVVVRVREK